MPGRPLIGVLALQGDVVEHLRALERCGVEGVRVRTAADLQRVDALVLPGGESTTMSRLLRVFGLEPVLRSRLDRGMPTLSTCAGMILLARDVLDGRPDQLVLGALDIAVRRNGYGRQVDSFEVSVELDGIDDGPLSVAFIRAPVIEDVGPAATGVGTVDGRPVAVEQGPHLALAFHPELGGEFRAHRHFLERAGLLARAA